MRLDEHLLRQHAALTQPDEQACNVCVSVLQSTQRCHVVLAPDAQPQAVCRNESDAIAQVHPLLWRRRLCWTLSCSCMHIYRSCLAAKHPVLDQSAASQDAASTCIGDHCLLQVRAVPASGDGLQASIAEITLSPGQESELALLPAVQPAMRVLDEEGKEYSWEAPGELAVYRGMLSDLHCCF